MEALKSAVGKKGKKERQTSRSGQTVDGPIREETSASEGMNQRRMIIS